MQQQPHSLRISAALPIDLSVWPIINSFIISLHVTRVNPWRLRRWQTGRGCSMIQTFLTR